MSDQNNGNDILITKNNKETETEKTIEKIIEKKDSKLLDFNFDELFAIAKRKESESYVFSLLSEETEHKINNKLNDALATMQITPITEEKEEKKIEEKKPRKKISSMTKSNSVDNPSQTEKHPIQKEKRASLNISHTRENPPITSAFLLQQSQEKTKNPKSTKRESATKLEKRKKY